MSEKPVVYFYDDHNFVQGAEIIGVYGPWYWLATDASLHTELRENCKRNPDNLTDKHKKQVW